MRSIVLAAHKFLESPDPVLVLQAVVFVDQKVKWQFEFVDEFFVGCGVVDAHAQHFDASLAEIGHAVLQAAGLIGTAGRIVLRVEVERQFLACVIFERLGAAFLIERFKCRRWISFIQMMHDIGTEICGCCSSVCRSSSASGVFGYFRHCRCMWM